MNYIELGKDDYTCSVFGNVFTVKEIIKFKITIRERGEIPIHNHKIWKYIINSLNIDIINNDSLNKNNICKDNINNDKINEDNINNEI